MNGELTLSLDQMMIVGFVASVLVQGFKLLMAWKPQVQISKLTATLILFVLSVVIAYLFVQPKILLWPTDPMELATLLVGLAVQVLGMATLIYNVLLDKVLNALNVTPARLLKAP